MKIHTFNTGREYTKHGQRVAWALLLREVGGGNIVAFVDADRGIDGVVRVDGHTLPDNLDVLNQYDKCAYLHNYLIPGDVEDALREAALKHVEGSPRCADTASTAPDELPVCESCADNGELTPATKMVPSSPDQGKTVAFSPVCAAHAAGWWDGADWDGRHLETPLSGQTAAGNRKEFC